MQVTHKTMVMKKQPEGMSTQCKPQMAPTGSQATQTSMKMDTMMGKKGMMGK